jgi:lipopolysaccharide biosynthesis regulator YciM
MMNETAKFNRELTADVIEDLRSSFQETPPAEAAIEVAQTLYGSACDWNETLDLFPKLQRHKYGPATSELNKLIQKLAVTADYMRASADSAESALVSATQHSKECEELCNEIVEALKKKDLENVSPSSP